MKKLALVAFSVSILLLSNVSAKETLMDIHLVGISSTAANIDSKEIGIGYGVSLYLDNSIFWGLSAYIGELGHLNRKHLDSLCKNIF
uniref:hypothetical protein n=1 Tax=Aliarcobacter sp. TaxID=2321116 RepID=UPI004048E727